MDYNLREPHMLHYNFTMERQLPSNISVSLAWAGSRGFNQPRSYDVNAPLPAAMPDGRLFWTGNEATPNPNWTTVTDFMAFVNSWYNSLQLLVSKRLSKGLEFTSAFSWQKLVDQKLSTSSQDNGGSSGLASAAVPLSVDQGLADWDVEKVWRLSTIYHLPMLSGVRGVAGSMLNGWWVSGILTAQTGLPFTPTVSSNRSRSQARGGGDRPDRILGHNNSNTISGASTGCSGVPAGTRLGTPNRYFDPCAFSIQPAGFLGTSGRNIP